jgi:hypothetical protein
VAQARAARESADDEQPDQATWNELANRQPDSRVSFPAPSWSPAAVGNQFRSYDDPGPVVNSAAAGELYRPSPASGQRALHGHLVDRFGGRVDPR